MAIPPNLHSLYNSGQPLCVLCLDCWHRSAVPPEKVGASRGDMNEIRSLKLKCSKCGSKNFEAYVVHSAERVAQFLEGLTLDNFRDRPKSHVSPNFG
jgi:hypothetical protein